jgi:hypothetical protein
MGSIVTSRVSAGGLPKASGYTEGFGFLLIVAVLAVVAALAIPAARRRAEPSRRDPARNSRNLIPSIHVEEPS